MRMVAAVIVGVAALFAAVLLAEALAHQLFPVPAGTPPSGYVAATPPAGRLLVAAGWFLGPFAGAAAALGLARWQPAAWIVAALAVAAGVANLGAVPHPVWMQAAAVMLPLLAAFAALRLVPARRSRR